MHLHIVRVATPTPQDAAPGKGDPTRDASQGAPRAGTARAVASTTGRLRQSEREPPARYAPAAPTLRMWRNRDTHRSQKPAASAMGVRLPPSALPVARSDGCHRRRPAEPARRAQETRPVGARSVQAEGRASGPLSVRPSTGFRPRAQRFDSSRGLHGQQPPPTTRHRGRAARHAPQRAQGGSIPPGVSQPTSNT